MTGTVATTVLTRERYMAIDITVPQLGESIVEATVVQWFKEEGDPVATGEALLELETEKVTLEVNANDSGVLVRIERTAGEDVKIGDLLGVLEDGGVKAAEQATAAAEQATAAAEQATAAGEQAAAAGEQAAAAGEQAAAAGEQAAADQADEVADDRVTPVARRMADEAGISLAGLEGTGMGGRICREDVERAVAARKENAVSDKTDREPDVRGSGRTERQASRSRDSAATDAPAQTAAVSSEPTVTPESAHPARTSVGSTFETRESREEVIPMSRRRRTIASRLVEAQQTAAMLTTFNEIDMSAVMTIRRKNRESFEKRHGVRLGFMSFFVKAVIGALREFPELNAEIREDSIVRKHYYDIGIAVGAEDGLVVPVLRDADRMTFAEIEGGIREYAARAGDGKLSLEDLRGGTFTITNGGVFGSMLSTPILNPPQVGILGLHRIDDRPIAVDGEIVIRPMMYAALTYDHRIIDGREAVQFLGRIKSLIEVPAELLLDV